MPSRMKKLFPWKLPRRRSFVTRRKKPVDPLDQALPFLAATLRQQASTSTAPDQGTFNPPAGSSSQPGTSSPPPGTSTQPAGTLKPPSRTYKALVDTSNPVAGTSRQPVGSSSRHLTPEDADNPSQTEETATGHHPNRQRTTISQLNQLPYLNFDCKAYTPHLCAAIKSSRHGRNRRPYNPKHPPYPHISTSRPIRRPPRVRRRLPTVVLVHRFLHRVDYPTVKLQFTKKDLRETLREDDIRYAQEQAQWKNEQIDKIKETLELIATSTLINSESRTRPTTNIGDWRPRSRSLDSQVGSPYDYIYTPIDLRRADRFTHRLPRIPLREYLQDASLLYRSVDNLLNTEAEPVNLSFQRRRLSTHRQARIYDLSLYLPDWGQEIGYAPMWMMSPLEDDERKIIIEFCHLLEKSKQLFNGLRELPQYGHKQWHSYFGRTFDVYTKLWKFQQQHRLILDSKYGLKRWQIGEIASKIGQLYYHFYLRTSDTTYLSEAFAFYHAIRGRSYYTKAVKEDKCELMVKKLRYYTRFTVVSLLMKRTKLVKELIMELDNQIKDYGMVYNPTDQGEWTIVVEEVKAFIQAEPVVTVIHPDNYPVILSHRLSPMTTPPVDRLPQMTLSLQEILIIGNSSYQVKFSELTMDMFRMLQTVEREPAGDTHYMYDSPRQRYNNSTPNMPQPTGYHLENVTRKDNPHKYLLFKPSPSQVLVYLSSGCNDLPPNGALLLYISADGQNVQPPKQSDNMAYDIGGVITTISNTKNDPHRESNKESKQNDFKYKDQCLYPGDIYPFTRKPLFIIVDSDSSVIFQNIPRHFGQPLVVLMSPMELPQGYYERRNQGNLFTLFLHSPLTAICYICDIHTMSLMQWDRSQNYIDTFLAEASQLITRTRIDISYITFMGDDFLRLLLLRFIFCEVTLRLHRAFRSRSHLTKSSPPIPEEVFDNPTLVRIIMDLVSYLQVWSHFHEALSSGPSTSQGPSRPLEP